MSRRIKQNPVSNKHKPAYLYEAFRVLSIQKCDLCSQPCRQRFSGGFPPSSRDGGTAQTAIRSLARLPEGMTAPKYWPWIIAGWANTVVGEDEANTDCI